MREIYKKIIIFLLIISLVAPTYASVVGSDGSSFVTKAEFDSELSNFNSRLTSFESSINSRIDSQVSSFLERNGIWSGKKQTIHSTEYCQYIYSSSAVNNVYITKLNGNYTWGPKTYIEKINKSGLLVGKWLWKNATGANTANTKWGWSYYLGAAADWAPDSGFTLCFNIYQTKSGETDIVLKYSDNFLSTLGKNDISTNGNYKTGMWVPLSATAMYSPFQIFVDRDAKLTWDIRCMYNFNKISDANPVTASSSTNDSDSTIYVEMCEAKVY